MCHCVVKGIWPPATRFDIGMVTKSTTLTRPVVSTVGHFTHAELTSEKSDRLRGEQAAPSRDFKIKSIDGLKLTVKTDSKKNKTKRKEDEMHYLHNPLDRRTPTEFRYHSEHMNHRGEHHRGRPDLREHPEHRLRPEHRDHPDYPSPHDHRGGHGEHRSHSAEHRSHPPDHRHELRDHHEHRFGDPEHRSHLERRAHVDPEHRVYSEHRHDPDFRPLHGERNHPEHRLHDIDHRGGHPEYRSEKERCIHKDPDHRPPHPDHRDIEHRGVGAKEKRNLDPEHRHGDKLKDPLPRLEYRTRGEKERDLDRVPPEHRGPLPDHRKTPEDLKERINDERRRHSESLDDEKKLSDEKGVIRKSDSSLPRNVQVSNNFL